MRELTRAIILSAPRLIIWGLFLSLPLAVVSQNSRPYEILVVGDSHISGQGLRLENKSYYLVKEWLQNEVLGANRKVRLNVKAHAGSRIELHQKELEEMQGSGDDINKFHFAEANISSPSIRAQIDIARAEYEDPRSVDLVMLSGCITDVSVAGIVNPFYSEKKLRERIRRYCGVLMIELLEHITSSFPNARVIVLGYFPIAASKSDVNKMARYFLKILNFPPRLHFLFTNTLSRQFLKILRSKIAKRSRAWLSESDRELRAAIAKINMGLDNPKAFFAESPITESSSYATKKPLLWEIGENHLPNDETYEERKIGCAKVFSEMKYQHYGRLSRRMCELSSVAHPNVEGSRAFAEAIMKVLKASVFISEENVGSR